MQKLLLRLFVVYSTLIAFILLHPIDLSDPPATLALANTMKVVGIQRVASISSTHLAVCVCVCVQRIEQQHSTLLYYVCAVYSV